MAGKHVTYSFSPDEIFEIKEALKDRIAVLTTQSWSAQKVHDLQHIIWTLEY